MMVWRVTSAPRQRKHASGRVKANPWVVARAPPSAVLHTLVLHQMHADARAAVAAAAAAAAQAGPLFFTGDSNQLNAPQSQP